MGDETDFAVRFHLHPHIKASRLADGRAVMLVLPNRDVWTFEALDDQVELEDSVFLAGTDGPRRTAQIVIRQERAPGLLGALEFCALGDLGRRHHGPAQCAARAGTAAVATARRLLWFPQRGFGEWLGRFHDRKNVLRGAA